MTSHRRLISLVGIATLVAACQGAMVAAPSPSPERTTVAQGTHRVAVRVDGQGFHPDAISVTAGQPVTVVFTRTTDQTCATEVVFPSLHLRRPLPLNQPVEVSLTPTAGRIAFACGMDMMHGAVVAQ
jgi:plastocyanin domain-containing protein